MKRISTLLTAVAVFLTVQVKAQYFENFDNGYASAGQSCIDTTNIKWASSTNQVTSKFIIEGTGSAYGEPAVSTTDIRIFSTPYLALDPTVTINFDYKLSQKLATSAYRYIVVGWVDVYGVFNKIDSIPVADDTKRVNRTVSTTVAAGTVGRIVFRMGGGGGDGNSRVSLDNISVSGSLVNNGMCNQAPIAYDNMYFPEATLDVVSGNLILDATSISNSDVDTDPGSTVAGLTASLLPGTSLTEGDLVLNSNGSFTFTPYGSFMGGPVTFSYIITDNGAPRLSDTAVVTLNYPDAAIIPAPVKLISFAGNVNANKAQLKWSVTDNETGDKFQVLRSTDGRNFSEISTVFISTKAGAESYTFADPKELDAITYYRLKIINKDGSVAFSNIISLKSATEKSSTGITILKNPVESTLTFTYSANTASQGQVSIYNTVGVKVYSSRLSSQKGINAVSLNLDSHMAAGAYILEVVNGTERAVTRMIKQ